MKLFPLATWNGQLVQNELSLHKVYWANKNHLFYLQVFQYLLVTKVYHLLYTAAPEISQSGITPATLLVWPLDNSYEKCLHILGWGHWWGDLLSPVTLRDAAEICPSVKLAV